MPTEPLLAGVDGCRGGWVVVTVPREGGGAARVRVVTHARDVVAELESGRIGAAGIDIPIGLPACRPRPVDLDARRRLGPRRNSVFPAPVRAVLATRTFQEACEASQAACGKKVSMQLFNILPKIKEVDDLQSPRRQATFFEACPELSFAMLVGTPMPHHKGTAAGSTARVRALRAVFPDVARHAARPPAGAKADDVLDAFALAWTARRFVAGDAVRLCGEPDAHRLRMEMIA
jgi:predicted RNase H-like nuclease